MEGNDSPVAFTQVAGAAKYLGIGERTVWELIRNGEIPTYRSGKKIFLLRYFDIDAFIETKKDILKSQIDKIVDEILESFIGKRWSRQRSWTRSPL